jgi:hypothetical protein
MEAIYNSIYALAGLREEVEKNKKGVEEIARTIRERNKLMDDGTRLMERLRTPLEAFGDELARVNMLWQEGAISTEAYERAVARAQQSLDATTRKLEKMDDDAAAYARSMESAFSSLFFDVLDGRMENLAENWSRTLKRMLAEYLASQLFQYMGGGAGGAGGGTGGGGTAPTVTAARSTGLTRDTGVSGPGDGGRGAGDVTVLIENRGSPVQATEGRAQIDARGLVVSVVLDDLHRGGPIAGNLETTYRLKRRN